MNTFSRLVGKLAPAATLLLMGTACVPGTTPPRATPPDAGAGVADAGPVGPTGPSCDPVAGTGCEVEAGTTCVWDPDTDRAACQVLTSHLLHRDPCYPDEPSCGAGLTCTALRNDETTTCYQVCDPESGQGCEALGSGLQHFVCSALEGLSQGVCLVAGSTCDPLLDSCGAGEVCGFRGGQTTCLAAGEVPLGGDCSVNGCAPGGLCLKLTDRARAECFAPCDPGQPRCPGGDAVCSAIDGHPFGVCQKSEQACTPMADSCVGGTICGVVGAGTSCVAPGPKAIGEACDHAACAQGGVCLRLGDEPTPLCRQPCDLGLPRCSGATSECYDVGLTFGVCD